MRTLLSKRMAKKLKILCGNSYHPRKFDLEDSKPSVSSSNRGWNSKNNNIPQPIHNFQPLSHIQGIPPYVHFINPSNIQPNLYSNHNYQPQVFNNRPIQQQVVNDGDNPNSNTAAKNISSGYQQPIFSQANIQPPVNYFLPPQQVNLQNHAQFFR